MLRGWLRMWWHCLWRLHRMETCYVGIRPIGFDCECGKHFWRDERYLGQYKALRTLFSGDSV